MTVKTLTYIHQLLIENETRRSKALEIARKARNDAEETGADNLPTLEDLYKIEFKACAEARDALADFEAREW